VKKCEKKSGSYDWEALRPVTKCFNPIFFCKDTKCFIIDSWYVAMYSRNSSKFKSE
jgi:hypothetical protein